MTEIEELKAQIKVLEAKLSFLEEIEKQPRMNLQQEGEYAVVSYHDKVYYRLMGETTFSWYIKKGVSDYHIHYRSPNLVMVEDAETERLLEGLYYNYIQVKKEKVAQEPEDTVWKSVALRFGRKLPVILPYSYDELSPDAWFRWAVFTYDNYMKQRDKESGYTPKAQQTENWKETQKLIDEEDNDKNFKNSLDLIKEWGEKNKPKTLHQICMGWWDEVFVNQMDDDICVDTLVTKIDKEFIPPSSDRNSYEWEKCLELMRNNLR
jgi:hypothetical protein